MDHSKHQHRCGTVQDKAYELTRTGIDMDLWDIGPVQHCKVTYLHQALCMWSLVELHGNGSAHKGSAQIGSGVNLYIQASCVSVLIAQAHTSMRTPTCRSIQLSACAYLSSTTYPQV